ncbi:hypothetical protein [Nostoc sp.]
MRLPLNNTAFFSHAEGFADTGKSANDAILTEVDRLNRPQLTACCFLFA